MKQLIFILLSLSSAVVAAEGYHPTHERVMVTYKTPPPERVLQTKLDVVTSERDQARRDALAFSNDLNFMKRFVEYLYQNIGGVVQIMDSGLMSELKRIVEIGRRTHGGVKLTPARMPHPPPQGAPQPAPKISDYRVALPPRVGGNEPLWIQ